jgi:hypothetical protein
MAVTRKNQSQGGQDEPKGKANATAGEVPDLGSPAGDLEFDNQEPEEAKAEEAKAEEKPEPAKPGSKAEEKPKEDAVEALRKIVEQQQELIERLAAKLEGGDQSAAGQLGQLLKKVEAGQDRDSAGKAPTLRDIQADMLDEPVRYFAYCYKFAILGYTADSGHEIKVPDGSEVKFDPFQRYSRKTTARGVDTVSISMYSTKSRRMVEFLDNHPFFNVRFYRATGRKEVVGMEDHMYAVDAYHKVSKMADMQVVEMLQNLGIPSSEDISEMRKELIRNLAAEMMAVSKKRLQEVSTELATTALSRMR